MSLAMTSTNAIASIGRIDFSELAMKLASGNAILAVFSARRGDEPNEKYIEDFYRLIDEYLQATVDWYRAFESEEAFSKAGFILSMERGERTRIIEVYARKFFGDNFTDPLEVLVKYMQRYGLSRRPRSPKHQQMLEFLQLLNSLNNLYSNTPAFRPGF